MRKPLARITITVAADLVEKADTRAKSEGRSRSWVLAEALRRYVAEKPAPLVKEPPAPPYVVRPGLGEQRLAQLKSDMALTPEQRVLESEESWQTALKARPQPRVSEVLVFDRLEDYYAWKKRDLLW